MRVTAVLLGLLGCGLLGPSPDDAVTAALEGAVAAGPGTSVALADHAPFAWDRVCVFGPYTPPTEVARVTGVPTAGDESLEIESRDDVDVLLFLDGGAVVRSVAHPRVPADFAPEALDRCYPRAEATFVVRGDSALDARPPAAP